MTKGTDAAFRSDGFYKDEENNAEGAAGLTKREYFAAAALSGVIVSGTWPEGRQIEIAAQVSVEAADALIDALNTETK